MQKKRNERQPAAKCLLDEWRRKNRNLGRFVFKYGAVRRKKCKKQLFFFLGLKHIHIKSLRERYSKPVAVDKSVNMWWYSVRKKVRSAEVLIL